jgi:hypothetical protein
MNPTLDDSRYAYSDSWWHPHFLEPGIDKDFRLQLDVSALSSARTVLVILVLFWCGFVWFDQFLSPSVKFRVLEFRFAIVTPIFLLLGAFSLSKAAASYYQPMIVLGEPVEILTNLKMSLGDVDENLAMKDFYGKIIERSGNHEQIHTVRFTSVPPEVDAYFQSHRQHAAKLHPI